MDLALVPTTGALLCCICHVVGCWCACCRVDKDRRRYTGALCGLGCSTDDMMPLMPDHDMEIAFDVEIDDEDIHLVSASSCRFIGPFGAVVCLCMTSSVVLFYQSLSFSVSLGLSCLYHVVCVQDLRSWVCLGLLFVLGGGSELFRIICLPAAKSV